MSEPYIGQVCMFAGNFAPRGWMFCQGQLLAISTNTALFSILGTVYGGDGRTTFALPDLRGRFPTHPGTGPGLSAINLGEMAGMERESLSTAQMPAHNHTLIGASASVAIPTNSAVGSSKVPTNNSVLSTANDLAAGAEVDIYAAASGADGTLAPFNAAVNGNTAINGSSMPVNIRNPYLGINFIIAVEGIFPPRN